MSKIRFIYEKNIFEMEYEESDLIENLFEKYIDCLSIEKKNLLFLYKGINILENTFILNKLKNNIIIVVIKKNRNNKDNNANEECSNLTFLNISKEYLILDNTIKKYKNEYSIDEFLENQEIKENKINCDICKNNKSLYDDNFYICSCNKNICQLCMINHTGITNHNLLYFNKRYFNCHKHLLENISYCSNCDLNPREKREIEHYNHKNKIIQYKKEKINDKKKDEIEKELKENISKINEYKNEINRMNDIFNDFLQNMIEELDNYNKLYNKMFIILHHLNNYQNIKNILNCKNISIIKEINIFLKEDLKNKLKYLVNKYIFYKREYTLIYEIEDKK